MEGSHMPRVKIPPPYRGPTLGRAAVEVVGGSVRACIEAVEAEYPGFAELIFDPSGGVQPFVTLFVNGEELGRSEADTSVGADDEVEILAAIAGG
jgi:molybdopterin converting factor small subunit